MPMITSTDGTKLYYEEAGIGTPVVFVHEFAGDYRTWEPQMRYFCPLASLRDLFRRAAIRLLTCRAIRRDTDRISCAATWSR